MLNDKVKYNALVQLFDLLSFYRNDATHSKEKEKMLAIVAGSYAAFLANAVHRHKDVDVFVLWNPPVHGFQWFPLLRILDPNYAFMNDGYLYEDAFRIANIGRLQIIVMKYENPCRCVFHVDKLFFEDWHHVTRYELLVFQTINKHGLKKDVYTPKYIPYNEDDGIITETIRIPKALDEKKYPGKHRNNMVNLHPPSLRIQALLKVIKFGI